MFHKVCHISQFHSVNHVTSSHWTENDDEDDDDGSAQLLRTKSDAGILRRAQRRSPSDQRRIRRHRFSINGHFYNHKVTLWHCSICPPIPFTFPFTFRAFRIRFYPERLTKSTVVEGDSNILLWYIKIRIEQVSSIHSFEPNKTSFINSWEQSRSAILSMLPTSKNKQYAKQC